MIEFFVAVFCFVGMVVNAWLGWQAFKEFTLQESWDKEAVNLGLFILGCCAAFWMLALIGVQQAIRFMG